MISTDGITRNAGGWALFLDVDGTLLEIAETPAAVRVPDSLKELLTKLSVSLDGALALISGRGLDDIDRLFQPLRFCAAGVHGNERRQASGCIVRAAIDPHCLGPARDRLVEFSRLHDGVLIEDKGSALAVHFRRAPQLSADVDDLVRGLCEQLGAAFAFQAGKCVCEIRPARCNKGTSIDAFMTEPPFRGRMPIYFGDDLTDEAGFAAVNELGGLSIKVGHGRATLASHRLPGVRDVHRWLEGVALPAFELQSSAESIAGDAPHLRF
jgi:trehalose 6-phosphate phosphatase